MQGITMLYQQFHGQTIIMQLNCFEHPFTNKVRWTDDIRLYPTGQAFPYLTFDCLFVWYLSCRLGLIINKIVVEQENNTVSMSCLIKLKLSQTF